MPPSQKSEAPEVAASEASEPTNQLATERGSSNTMIPQSPDPDQTPRYDAHCAPCGEYLKLPGGETDHDDFQEWVEAHENCGEPVNLDLDEPDLPPEIVRWREMAESYEDLLEVYHGGDASMVMDMERPGWSNPDRDYVGTCISQCCYKSSIVRVAASLAGGVNDGDTWERAHVSISAKLWGDGTTGIALTPHRIIGAEWKSLSINLTAEEALEVADVLQAAVKLIGGTK